MDVLIKTLTILRNLSRITDRKNPSPVASNSVVEQTTFKSSCPIWAEKSCHFAQDSRQVPWLDIQKMPSLGYVFDITAAWRGAVSFGSGSEGAPEKLPEKKTISFPPSFYLLFPTKQEREKGESGNDINHRIAPNIWMDGNDRGPS